MPSLVELITKRTPKSKSDIWPNGDMPKLVTYVNPYTYVTSKQHAQYFAHFDYITSDGALFIPIYKAVANVLTQRMSPDLGSYFQPLFQEAEAQGDSFFFIGTKPKVIDIAIENIKEKYPALNILGYSSGYFNQDEREELLNKIVNLQPKFVIVGMGTPLQEMFLADLVAKGWKGYGYTCGGFLHQTATKLDYYPKWINQWNLRWAYRIYDEPKLVTRYLIDYPKGIWMFMTDYWKMNKSSNT